MTLEPANKRRRKKLSEPGKLFARFNHPVTVSFPERVVRLQALEAIEVSDQEIDSLFGVSGLSVQVRSVNGTVILDWINVCDGRREIKKRIEDKHNGS